ncbi:hypothetical protein [Halobaculum sp. MBLA0143]|uniref:hypothetical protein n=1 Tax=Halobaculum sp. MBLA0143 TaxID=3079933 RepID=UPI0035232235
MSEPPPYPLGEEPPVDSSDRFLAHVAEANRCRDGSPPRHVACVVCAVETTVADGDGVVETTLTNAAPYRRDRVPPAAVVRAVPETTATDGETTRERAVTALADALRRYYDTHGWDGITRE